MRKIQSSEIREILQTQTRDKFLISLEEPDILEAYQVSPKCYLVSLAKKTIENISCICIITIIDNEVNHVSLAPKTFSNLKNVDTKTLETLYG